MASFAPSRIGRTTVELARAFRFILGHPLNRGRPVRTIARYVEWQLYKRATGRARTIPFVNGTVLRVYGDNRVGASVLYTGLPEYDEMSFLLRFLKPADTIVDVGANIGMYTILGLSAATSGRAFAFEPHPQAFGRLSENVAINLMNERATLHRAAVGERVGEVSFTSGGDGTNHIADLSEQQGTLRVPMTTLDIALAGCNKIAAVKLDVEGAELRVLEGARDVLANSRPLVWIVELIGLGARYGAGNPDVIGAFRDYGYRPYKFLAETRQLVPFRREIARGNNALFLRDVDETRRRLGSS